MSGGDSDRSLGGKFADFLDSLGLENLTDDYRDHKREADDRLDRTFEAGPEAVATTPELAEEFVTDPTGDIEMLRERIEAGDDSDDGVPPVYWQVFDARSPAGSGAYAGLAPIYTACQRELSSAVGEMLSSQEMVYTGGSAGF